MITVGFGQEVPVFNEKWEYVQDHAGVFSNAQRAHLNSILKSYDTTTSIEIVVVTTANLGGYDMFTFTQKLGDVWKPGKQGLDNGIILHLTVDPDAREVRFHTGYGIENELPDIACGHIIDQDMMGLLKQEHYAEALLAGVQAVQRTLGEKSWEQRLAYNTQVQQREKQETAALLQGFLMVLLGLMVIGGITAIIYIPIQRKRFLQRTRQDAQKSLGNVKQTFARATEGIPEKEKLLQHLRENYPPVNWNALTGFASVVAKLHTKAEQHMQRATTLLKSEKRDDIIEAASAAAEALILANQAEASVLAISARLADLRHAQQTVPEELQKLTNALAIASKTVADEKVGKEAKAKLSSAEKSLQAAKASIAETPIDWLEVSKHLRDATQLMGSALSYAEDDLHPRQTYTSLNQTRRTSSFGGSRSGGGAGYKPGGGRFGGGGAGRKF